eukprot:IDg18332t1
MDAIAPLPPPSLNLRDSPIYQGLAPSVDHLRSLFGVLYPAPVHLPESDRGGCSFGARLNRLSRCGRHVGFLSETSVAGKTLVCGRAVDELDWAALQSCIIFDLPAFGAVWRDSAACPKEVAICVEPDRTGGDISRLGRKAVSAFNRQSLNRSPSTISREVRRNGGRQTYRAAPSDQRAWAAQRGPNHVSSRSMIHCAN